jgi:predicted DCC family thiol-disulfide oxidoreductase YuxK
MKSTSKNTLKIIFFDGYCSLCNSMIDWLIKIDTLEVLQFASLQGVTAIEKLGPPQNGLGLDTVVYWKDGKKFFRSAAVLEALGDLGGVWRFVWFFKLVPAGLRDFLYKLVARNRYKVFGKRETCRVPSPSENGRLLP